MCYTILYSMALYIAKKLVEFLCATERGGGGEERERERWGHESALILNAKIKMFQSKHSLFSFCQFLHNTDKSRLCLG